MGRYGLYLATDGEVRVHLGWPSPTEQWLPCHVFSADEALITKVRDAVCTEDPDYRGKFRFNPSISFRDPEVEREMSPGIPRNWPEIIHALFCVETRRVFWKLTHPEGEGYRACSPRLERGVTNPSSLGSEGVQYERSTMGRRSDLHG